VRLVDAFVYGKASTALQTYPSLISVDQKFGLLLLVVVWNCVWLVFGGNFVFCSLCGCGGCSIAHYTGGFVLGCFLGLGCFSLGV
jgi:hypothetical protein